MTTKGDPLRFVVLSEARSGTSLLTETLNTHPEITCHGEVFHPNPDWHFRGDMADWSKDRIIDLRDHETEFLERVYDQPDTRAVGFKMWRIQAPDACARLLADETVWKIILQRSNALSQYSSTLLAKQTGVWNLNANDKGGPPQPEPLIFNKPAFKAFLAHQNDTFGFYRDRASGPVMDLTYEQLVQHGFDGVQTFLNVTRHPLTSQKQRLHSTDILARFRWEDHAEIREELDVIGHPEWVSA